MKKIAILFLVGLFLYPIMHSCSGTADATDPDDELRAVWNEFEASWNSLDAKACASFYDEVGLNIPPGLEPKHGQQDIEAFYAMLFSQNSAAVYKHEILSVSAKGDWAIEQGKFRVDWTTNDGSEWVFNGRSLTHWEKNDNGQWKIMAFMFNTP